jgi:hypothetical protein
MGLEGRCRGATPGCRGLEKRWRVRGLAIAGTFNDAVALLERAGIARPPSNTELTTFDLPNGERWRVRSIGSMSVGRLQAFASRDPNLYGFTRSLTGGTRVGVAGGTMSDSATAERRRLAGVFKMRHVALLGDSVFDNRSYTRGEPDVAQHLRELLPRPSTVTLCAVDGSTTHDVTAQFDRVPKSANDIVLSLGGNDALMSADLLNLPVRSTAEALDLFRDRVAMFATSYGHVIEGLIALGRRVTVCTIYNGNLAEPEALRAPIALSMFNDVILRCALRFGLPAIELRAVCDRPEDFANPIEPSGSGGRKIAAAIVRSLANVEREPGRSTVTAG